MKRLLAIYLNDMSRIGRNWAAIVMISGLAFLPSLYAWFNILASWDPYSNTGSLAIAVVNEDRGATARGKELRLGDEIIASLRDDRRIGWTFVDAAEAERGVLRGEYFAALTIPPEFSEHISSVLTATPQKAEILYDVNEKTNAISPKITSKGASGILDEVTRQFIRTANGTIFAIMNEVGLELERELPAIEAGKAMLFRLEELFPELNRLVDAGLTDLDKAQAIAAKAENYIPEITRLAEAGSAMTEQLGVWIGRTGQALDALSPGIKQDLYLLQQAAIGVKQLNGLLQDVKTDPAILQSELDRVGRRLAVASDVNDKLISLFERLNGLTGGKGSAAAAQKLQKLQRDLQLQAAIMERLSLAMAKGEKPAGELIADLGRVAGDTASGLEDLLGRYDTEIAPGIAEGAQTAKQKLEQAHEALAAAAAVIPDAGSLVSGAAKGLAAGRSELAAIKQALPALEAKVKELADRLRAFEQQGNLGDILRLLKLDAQKESEFFAEPVVLKENRLFPIPNYGSAMSPFFTTLSLWVGALLLVSLLTVEVHEEGIRYKSYQVYLGRFLTFLTIALVQSLFVTLGDLYLLHTFVAEPGWFVGFGLLLSALFMLIVYTLVSVFGNVGKAMAIVLLVLQLAGSGGTFPVQLTPPFFQAIHPFLPFTYAIGLMREAVGGLIWDVAVRDLAILAVYAGLALLIGLGLKKWINASSAKLVHKAKESRIIH
ncbi:putative membrane protein [Paenibacillus sp. UNCCL117]|uniref:YhgE/Pip domain-containing protein n=1 Tax=unclassified Paenibacillus TaxID=185978 RepID=UPI0008923EFF|nr:MULTISPECIES: YhgE/Pip domain-containing protein [unclassified Paenibacillus]SDD13756.1 putative membrane protein [Paenibacillus sp. cl123]SFW34055.1 putative membrane protein [Paenibacillus sp. UNCCL117]